MASPDRNRSGWLAGMDFGPRRGRNVRLILRIDLAEAADAEPRRHALIVGCEAAILAALIGGGLQAPRVILSVGGARKTGWRQNRRRKAGGADQGCARDR